MSLRPEGPSGRSPLACGTSFARLLDVAADPQTGDELLAGTEADKRTRRPLRGREIVKGTVASISGNERRGRDRRHSIGTAELAKTGEVVDAQVVDANSGGLVVDVGLRRLWVARVRRQAAAAQVIEADQ